MTLGDRMSSPPGQQPNSAIRVCPLPSSERSDEQRVLLERTFGEKAPNLFSTIVRHPKLFEAWIPFCLHLLESSVFSLRERELIILRTAWRCNSPYEWQHHTHIGRRVGISDTEIRSICSELDGTWIERERILLEAADELLISHGLGDPTWARLSDFLSIEQLIELPMLIGHYSLLAGTLNALAIPRDPARSTDEPFDPWAKSPQKSLPCE